MRRAFPALGVLLPLVAWGEPTLTPTTWRDLPAFRLTDGRTEAVVVPQLGGRCVAYGLIGGRNWLWNGEPGAEKKSPPLMWGGDKTYIGPHSAWALTMEKMWPPPSPDFEPHEVIKAPGVLFKTRSPEWPGYRARVERSYAFAENGDLIISHSIPPVSGSDAIVAVWQITQTIPTDWVYVPLNPQSPYKDNVFWFSWSKPPGESGATILSRTLLRLRPTEGKVYKLGAHPKVPALAAVKDREAFVSRADPQAGQYPEGADGAGFNIEVYHHDLPGPGEYTELEPLSPLRRLDQGAQLTTRWNIHPLPKATPAESTKVVERLLGLGED